MYKIQLQRNNNGDNERMSYKLSIIIPVYNCECKISNCINAIIQQTYCNFELLIINDGSTDNTEKVIKNFLNSDMRIKLINKKNGGPSSARNEGIKHAIGDYIIFIDADDIVPVNYVETLMFYRKYDLVICNLKKSKTLKNNSIEFIKSKSYSKKEFLISLEKFMNLCLVQGPTNKLFHKDIIKNNNIEFNCDFSLGEDTLFVYDYIKYIEDIFYTDETTYFYQDDNSESLCNRYRSNRLKIYMYLNEKLKCLLNSNNLDTSIVKVINTNAVIETINLIYKNSDNFNSFKESVENDVCENILNYDDLHCNRVSQTICILLIKYKIIYILYLLCKIKY